jgi:hypothetical protein
MAIYADRSGNKHKLAATEVKAKRASVSEQIQMGREELISLQPSRNNDLVRKDYVDSRIPNAAEVYFYAMLNG